MFLVVGVERLVCTFAVVVGFVISLIPQLIGDEQHPTKMCTNEGIMPLIRTNDSLLYMQNNQVIHSSVTIFDCMQVPPPPLWYRLMSPLIYALGFVPISIMFVLAEKEMKKYEGLFCEVSCHRIDILNSLLVY